MPRKLHPRLSALGVVLSPKEQTRKRRALTTSELLRRVRQRAMTCTEACLVLNGGARATHVLSYDGNGTYLHEGIDGVSEVTTGRAFTRAYAWLGKRRVWRIA